MIKVASVSGGKDSTAMLILLYDQGVSLDYIVFMNIGLDFPQTIRFVREKLNPWCKEHFGIEITFIYPKKPFGYYFGRWGVPYVPRGRWCCKHLKEEPFMEWLRDNINFEDVILYLGYAYDEKKRFEEKGARISNYLRRSGKNVEIRAPLIEVGITEREALEICRRHGLLNPLYRYFNRIGCWMCPFQPKSEWFKVYKYFPKLWNTAKIMETKSIEMGKHTLLPNRRLDDLEKEFRYVKTLVEI